MFWDKITRVEFAKLNLFFSHIQFESSYGNKFSLFMLNYEFILN